MRRVLPMFGLLFLASPVQAQTVLWFTGSETGDFGEYSTSVSANIATGAPTPLTGAYVLQTVTTGTGSHYAVSKASLAASEMYARVYFFEVGQNAGNQNIVQFLNAAVNKGMLVDIRASDNIVYWGHNTNAVIAAGTHPLAINTWHRIDAHCVVSASVGGCEVKVDGVTEFTSFGTDTSDVSAIDAAYFGCTATSVGAAQCGFDDLMLCSGAYCPDGHAIARQGTSGSPTYTAWTKNSCTSNLIENCWSQTPFDPTPNASDAVANDAQTMLVHGFETTQSGHGSQTFGGAATINACKTAMVAKSGTASAPISIRRRIASTDTDTSKTLTTSDAYYDDGIWTTSATNLIAAGGAQIGAVHGAGVATDTVEDMWLICDYGASGSAIRHRVTQ